MPIKHKHGVTGVWIFIYLSPIHANWITVLPHPSHRLTWTLRYSKFANGVYTWNEPYPHVPMWALPVGRSVDLGTLWNSHFYCYICLLAKWTPPHPAEGKWRTCPNMFRHDRRYMIEMWLLNRPKPVRTWSEQLFKRNLMVIWVRAGVGHVIFAWLCWTRSNMFKRVRF